MKINSPLSSINEVPKLIESGADSFYAGINFSRIYNKKILSSRWHCSNAEFQDLDEILDAARMIRKESKEIFLTVNEHNYTQEEMKDIVRFILRYSKEFTGFIVSNIALILELENKVNLVASTGLRISNSEAVKFYKDLGINKIIFPRSTKLNEAKSIISKEPNLDYEMFILNYDCHYIDGLCGFSHFLFDEGFEKGHACSNISTKNEFKKTIINSCGVCSIPIMKNIGIKYLKIVGRINTIEKKAKDIFFLKELIRLTDLNNYENLAKELYEKTYGCKCSENCFYRW